MNLNSIINMFFNTKTIDYEQNNNQPVKDKTINIDGISIDSLLPYRLYDYDNDLYINDNSISFIIELLPIIGGDETTSELLTNLITDGLPENCFISFINWASPNVENFLDRWVEPRERAGNLYKKQAFERKKFLMDGTHKSLYSSENFTIKNFRIFLTATMPFDKVRPETIIEKLKTFREILYGTLNTLGLFSLKMPKFTPDRLINFLNEIINPIADNNYEYITYDKVNPINVQIKNPENPIKILNKDTILFEKDNIAVRSFSAKQIPEYWAQWQCAELIGSTKNNMAKMGCPFLTCFSFFIENEEKRTMKERLRNISLTRKTSSSLVKFMPELKQQKEDSDFVIQCLNKGQKLVTNSYNVIIFDKLENIDSSSEKIKSIYKENGWTLKTVSYIHFQIYLSVLPFILGDYLKNDFFGRMEQVGTLKTLVSWSCANLLPVQGEYKGVASPVVQLIGRRGQPLYWDPFSNTGGNYNVAVIGKSGSGKSVFMQELVTSLRGTGCKTFVIDDGRSFMNTCLLQGGKFVYFAPDQNICLNPFSLLSENDSEDKIEDINLITNIIKTMCFNINIADDYQNSVINNAVLEIVKSKGKNATITDVKNFLAQKEDVREQDLAAMLTKFSKGGQYEKYFDGECNVEIDNDFITFEMAELKDKKDLQSIVLLVLMFIISKKMYYGNRKQKIALMIDEAWSLLAGGGSIGDFIEGFARRCRKYGGTLITGTQSVDDYYKNAGSTAALNNSDWMVLLAQKPEAIVSLKNSGKIIMDDTKEELLKSLRMVSGQYSELMITNSDGYFIGRLILDRFSLALYSSKAEDVAKIKELQEQGKTLEEAIEIVKNIVR